MNRLWHFIKWNFTDMQPHSKRMILYILIGIACSGWTDKGFLIAPVLMFLDLTVDIIRDRYADFRKEQQELVNTLKDSSK